MGCVGCIECGSGLGKGGLVVPFLAMRRVWYKKWCAGENVWRSGGDEISSPFGPFFPVCALFPNTPTCLEAHLDTPLFSRYLCASCSPIRIPSVYRSTTFSPCYFCPPVPLVFHPKHHHAQRQPNKSPCLSELLTAILFPLLLPLLSPLSPSRFAIPL